MAVSEQDSASAAAAIAADAREIVYRHNAVVRITHWINALCLVLLLMSGLEIFNAHPALYWGHYGYPGVPTVLLGGGVVANTRLRERLADAGEREGIDVLTPSLRLCTDNAAMVACLGAARWAVGERMALDTPADPQLRLAS